MSHALPVREFVRNLRPDDLPFVRRLVRNGSGALLLVAVAAFASASETESSEKVANTPHAVGQRIYSQQCQICHGKNGIGGTDGYTDPLTGDASINELTELISDTMPEEDPDLCVADDAKAVATYIHETFYSEAAQLRNRPAQQHFSRLTGTQLRQSLADLYQHFHSTPWLEKSGGLSGKYYDSGRNDKKKLKVERVDAGLDFDFGRESPVEGVSANEFSIYWSGSLAIPHSGRYEIVVESTCSMMMRFGLHDRVLINNHVQSEGKTEFRRSLTLIGGRQYPLWIEFRQRKRKTEQPPARFSLRWVPPGGSEAIIPPENLLPKTLPSSFALQTKLPPDDRTYGYARGTRIDRGWEDAVTAAALEFGDTAGKELWPHYKRRHRKGPDENRAKLRAFLIELASVAFRGDLDEATRTLYVDNQVDAEEDDLLAISRSCLLIIKSPRFLYPSLSSRQTAGYRVANRLSLVLHDSLPSDKWLLDRIDQNKFDPNEKRFKEEVRNAARKMVRDPRLQGKVTEMFFDWLHVDPAGELSKNTQKFPGFDDELKTDLRRSLERQLADTFWSEKSDYRDLFRNDWNWTTGRLAQFYGEGWIPASSDDGEISGRQLVRSAPSSDRSFGVLSHPLVMGHLSYYDATSPIHRGVFLLRHILGRTLRPPNEAFTPLDAELHPDLTTRERVELQTGTTACQVCHSKINALGFPLENFDAVGRFRKTEHAKPINASGGYITRDGLEVKFSSPRDLAVFLADNIDAHRAFVERVFEHFVKQPPAAFGGSVIDDLVAQFRDSEFNMRELVVNIAILAATHQSNLESTNGST